MSLDLKNRIEAGQFQEYCLKVETLTKYEVECRLDANGALEVKYNYGNGHFKFCRPLELDKKRKWWKKTPDNKSKPEVFGFKQLPENGEIVIITGGEKDVMAFDNFNIPAISLNSESASLPLGLLNSLKDRFKIVAICFDIDGPGIRFSKNLSEKFGLPRIELPEDLDGKDIYDFMASGRTKEELVQLFDLAIKTQQENKTLFTGKEVLESKKTTEFIIDGILPKSNFVGLIGGSDTGKSLLLLQFGISYILSKPILGFEVKGGKKVFYFSFEDDTNSLKNRLTKLLKGFSEKEKDLVAANIFFELDPERIEEKIENHMEQHPETGIVIIDPLTEILQGADMSNPSSVRERMQILKKVSTKYDLTLIFINHITKSSEESGKLNKGNSIGSQAIEAKSRVMFEMKKRLKGSILPVIELGIVKGNDIEERYKSSECSLSLKLDTDTFWFEKVETSETSTLKKFEIDWDQIFGENKKMKAQEIVQRLEVEYGFDDRKSRKIISEQIEGFRIQHGVYGKPYVQEKKEDGRAA